MPRADSEKAAHESGGLRARGIEESTSYRALRHPLWRRPFDCIRRRCQRRCRRRTTPESIFAAEGKRVVQLALEHKLPGPYPYKLMVDAGGLMAFDSYTL
jgi:hypothetical protein